MLFWDLETTGLDENAKIAIGVTRHNDTTTVWAENSESPQVLSLQKCDELAMSLIEHTDGPIVTFNGAGFDFKILCNQVSNNEIRRKLIKVACYNHVDIMLDFLSSKGYPSSLDSFLKGKPKNSLSLQRPS